MRTQLAKGAMLLFLWLTLAPDVGYAQLWSGILDPSRAIDWTQAGFTIREPASQCSNQRGAYSPSGGDDAPNINSLIAGCVGGGFILLSPGKFTLSSTGVKFSGISNVVLRGAGADKTKLLITAPFNCINGRTYVCFYGNPHGPYYYGPDGGGAAVWTGDNGRSGSYAKGDTVLDIGTIHGKGSCSNVATCFAVGQLVELDQRDDTLGLATSGAGCSEAGSTVTCNTTIPHDLHVGDTVVVGGSAHPANNDCGQQRAAGYAGYWTVTAIPSPTSFQYTDTTTGLLPCTAGYAGKDTRGVVIFNIVPITTENNNNYLGRVCPGSAGVTNPACASGEVSMRGLTETHVITAINASNSQITIAPPVYMNNFRSSQSPGIYWTGSYPAHYAVNDGIEDLTIDSSTGVRANDTVGFINAYKCWIMNSRIISGDVKRVTIYASMRINVLNNYIYGTAIATHSNYGINNNVGASSNLIQNNICQNLSSCLVDEGGVGNVESYNYSFASNYATPGYLIEAFSQHGITGMNLFEGNDTQSAEADSWHGSSTGMTLFRNRLRGQDVPAKIHNTNAFYVAAFNRGENVVGNILGTVGTQITYSAASQATNGNVYSLGFDVGTGTGVPYDSLVAPTLLRWGNYDVVTNAVRWCGNSSDPGWSTTCGSTSEVPTKGATFINGNPVPSSLSLPPSFYLQVQPSFWNMAGGYGPTPPWPAIGPDVRGGTAADGVGGFSYAIPAQLCYQHTPIDPSYQKSRTVSGATWSAGTATLNTNTAGLVVDNTISVSGLNPSSYNGIWQVTKVTSSSVSFSLPTNPGAYVSGGTFTSTNILLFNAANCYSYLQTNLPKITPPKGLTLIGVH